MKIGNAPNYPHIELDHITVKRTPYTLNTYPCRGSWDQPPRGVPRVSGLVGHFVQTWPDSECSHTVQCLIQLYSWVQLWSAPSPSPDAVVWSETPLSSPHFIKLKMWSSQSSAWFWCGSQQIAYTDIGGIHNQKRHWRLAIVTKWRTVITCREIIFLWKSSIIANISLFFSLDFLTSLSFLLFALFVFSVIVLSDNKYINNLLQFVFNFHEFMTLRAFPDVVWNMLISYYKILPDWLMLT